MALSTYRLAAFLLSASGLRPGRFSLRSAPVRDITMPTIGTGNGWHEPSGSLATLVGRVCSGDQKGTPVLAMLATRPAGAGAWCAVCSEAMTTVACVVRWCQHEAHAPAVTSAGACRPCTVALWSSARMRHGLTVTDASIARAIRARTMRATQKDVRWTPLTLDGIVPTDDEMRASIRTLRQREQAYVNNAHVPAKQDRRNALAHGRAVRDVMRPAVERIIGAADWRAALAHETDALRRWALTGAGSHDIAATRIRYLERRIAELTTAVVAERIGR